MPIFKIGKDKLINIEEIKVDLEKELIGLKQ